MTPEHMFIRQLGLEIVANVFLKQKLKITIDQNCVFKFLTWFPLKKLVINQQYNPLAKSKPASNLRSQKTAHSTLNGHDCYHDGFIQQTIAVLTRHLNSSEIESPLVQASGKLKQFQIKTYKYHAISFKSSLK